MWIRSKIMALFLALYRSVQTSLERVMLEEGYQRIKLTDWEYGLYLRFSNSKFELRNNVGEGTMVDLSLEEVRALFAAIVSACERQELSMTEIGGLSVRTDARPNPKHPDTLIVRFSAPISLNIDLSRQRVMSACEEFSSIFGPVTMRSDGNGEIKTASVGGLSFTGACCWHIALFGCDADRYPAHIGHRVESISIYDGVDAPPDGIDVPKWRC